MSPAQTALLTGLVALALPLVLLPVLRRAGAVDVPSHRSSHTATAVRGLGAATTLAVAVGLGGALAHVADPAHRWMLAVVGVGSVVAALVGLAEDVRGVSVSTRLLSHLAVGAAATAALVLPAGGSPLLVPLGAVAVAGFVNAANFMDGVDGITGLHGIVFGASTAVLGAWSGHEWLTGTGLVTAAAFAAFLPWNLSGRRLFLGDSGSYLLGAVTALSVVAALAVGVPAVAAVGVLAPYLADTGVTFLRRVASGARWSEPHRDHVFQRLTHSGLGHLRAAAVTTVASALSGGLSMIALQGSLAASVAGAGGALVVAAGYLATPRVLAWGRGAEAGAAVAGGSAGAAAAGPTGAGPGAAPRLLVLESIDLCVHSHFAGQLAELRRRGVDPVVLTRDTGLLADVLATDGVRGLDLDIARDPSVLGDLRTLVAIVRVIRRERPVGIVSGTPKAALLGAVAGWLTRVPVRVHLLLGLRVETMTGLGRVAQLAAERLTVRLSTETVAVGEGMRRRAVELGLDLREAQVVGRGSANGVDVARFAAAGRELASDLRSDAGSGTASGPDSDIGSGTDALVRFEAGLGRTQAARRVVGLAPEPEGPVVGFVGRLAVDKGLDCLVAAVRRVRADGVPAQLVLVGPDDGVDHLAPETRAALGEPWVVRPGLVADTASVYAAFDVFCLPSRREGLPTVVLEAAAAGVPVVVSDATGTADTVDDGRTGLIVPVDDVEAWAAAVAGVLGDPGGASRRAVLGREFVREHFAAEVVRQRYCDLYERRLRAAGAVLRAPSADPAPAHAPASGPAQPDLT